MDIINEKVAFATQSPYTTIKKEIETYIDNMNADDIKIKTEGLDNPISLTEYANNREKYIQLEHGKIHNDHKEFKEYSFKYFYFVSSILIIFIQFMLSPIGRFINFFLKIYYPIFDVTHNLYDFRIAPTFSPSDQKKIPLKEYKERWAKYKKLKKILSKEEFKEMLDRYFDAISTIKFTE